MFSLVFFWGENQKPQHASSVKRAEQQTQLFWLDVSLSDKLWRHSLEVSEKWHDVSEPLLPSCHSVYHQAGCNLEMLVTLSKAAGTEETNRCIILSKPNPNMHDTKRKRRGRGSTLTPTKPLQSFYCRPTTNTAVDKRSGSINTVNVTGNMMEV